MLKKVVFFVLLAGGFEVTKELVASQEKGVIGSFVEFYNENPTICKGLALAGIEIFFGKNSILGPTGDFDWRMILRQIDNENLLPESPIVDCDNIDQSNKRFELWLQRAEEIYNKRQVGYEKALSSYCVKNKSEKIDELQYQSYIEDRIKGKEYYFNMARNYHDEYVKVCLEEHAKLCLFNKQFDEFLLKMNETNY